MPAQDGLALHILKAELAHVEPPQAGVFLWIRRVVPGVQLVATEHDGFYHVAALRHLAGQPELLLLQPRTGGAGKWGNGEKVQRGQEERADEQAEEREEKEERVIQGRGSGEPKITVRKDHRKTSVEATGHEKQKQKTIKRKNRLRKQVVVFV